MADATTNASDEANKPTDGEPVKNEEHLKKLIHERDEAKRKLRAIEEQQEQAQKKALEETNQFKTLYEQQQEKVKRLAEVEARLADIDAKADARIEALSVKLPEAAKSEYDAFIKDLPRDKRLDWLQAKATAPEAKPSPATSRPAGNTATHGGLATMTFEQKVKMKRENPAEFAKLMTMI